jgi:CO/xanthine dehydrogenase Mo-binding subunit
MSLMRPSRRQVMGASLIGGIAVYLAPLGSRAFAALFEEQLLTRPTWNDGVLKYRIDGTSKVMGAKVFARDIRARDMPHWPQQQSHALVLRVSMADRIYAGFDLSALGSDLAPDRVVTAADLAHDGLAFPDFYGVDMLLPEGKTPAYLGQAVAILIYQDFARWRFAKEKLQFNDAAIRYGAVTGPLQRDPWGSARFVRVAGPTPYGDDVFSCLKEGPVSASYSQHEPVWPQPARDGDTAAQGMYYAKSIDDELAQPPADWLVLRRDYATQSGDTAALEPDNANGWYDREKEDLHLVVGTQSPQEVAAGAAAMLGKSRIGMKRLFLHPCFTVGYGSKDHCTMPYYGLLAAVYGDGRPVRLANDRFDQFQTGLKRHQFSMGYTVAVERKTGLLQSFRAEIVANGGGRANCSVALTMVGAVSAQSVYYFPKSDVAATAIASRAIDCGAARGYGGLETLTATELMMDEIAGELGLDAIEFRLRNVLKTGMRNTQGAIPLGTQRAEAVLERARGHALWTGRAPRKHPTMPRIPENITGSASAASSGASAPGPKRASPSWSSRRMGASRSPTAERRSAPAPPRRKPSPARAGWGGRPMRSTWASPSGPTCRWKRAVIRSPRPRRSASVKPIKTVWPRTRAGLPLMHRRRVPATRRTTSRIRRGKQRASFISMGYGRRRWQSGAATRARPRAR